MLARRLLEQRLWNNGWWGPAIAAGVLGGGRDRRLAAGGRGGLCGYGDGCWQVRPLYAPNGAWIGNGPVNVCQ